MDFEVIGSSPSDNIGSQNANENSEGAVEEESAELVIVAVDGDNTVQMKEVTLSLNRLEPGMILAQSVVTKIRYARHETGYPY